MTESATNTASKADRRVTIRHRQPAVRVRLDDRWVWSADWSVTGVAVHFPADDPLCAAITSKESTRFDGAVALAMTGPVAECGLQVARWTALDDHTVWIGLSFEDGDGAIAAFLADWTLTNAIRAGYRPTDVT